MINDLNLQFYKWVRQDSKITAKYLSRYVGNVSLRVDMKYISVAMIEKLHIMKWSKILYTINQVIAFHEYFRTTHRADPAVKSNVLFRLSNSKWNQRSKWNFYNRSTDIFLSLWPKHLTVEHAYYQVMWGRKWIIITRTFHTKYNGSFAFSCLVQNLFSSIWYCYN